MAATKQAVQELEAERVEEEESQAFLNDEVLDLAKQPG